MNDNQHFEASNTEKGFHSVVMIFSVLLILIALFLSGIALHGAVYGEQATREVLAKYGIDLYNLKGQNQNRFDVPEFASERQEFEEDLSEEGIKNKEAVRSLEKLKDEYETEQREEKHKVNSAVQMESDGQILPPRLKNMPQEEFYDDGEEIKVLDLDDLEPVDGNIIDEPSPPILETPEEMMEE